MPSLQEFDKLFAELQLAVDNLIKQRDALTQECTSLEAKKQFTEASSKELLAAIAEEQRTHQLAVDTFIEELRVLKESKDVLSSEVSKLQDLKLVIGQELDTVKQEQQAAAKDLWQQIEDLRQQITGLKQQEQDYIAAISQLQQEETAQRQVLAGLKADVAEAAKDTNDKRADLENKQSAIAQVSQNLDAELAGKQKLSLETGKELENLQNELSIAKQQQQLLLDYEKRARKILEARENAVLEREEKLEAAELRFKRKGGILDNL